MLNNLDRDMFQKFDEYLNNYKKQLAHFMYTHYAHVRIKRLFDIVIDFPDSKCAINDLKICLEKTNLRSYVVKALKVAIEQRLLHPGVNTSDILTAYVSAIKALMCLDSSGVMMENICQPLKKYLRNREDTVKCIVSNLTDDSESSNEIMEEFCKDLYSYEGSNEVIDSTTAQPIQLQNSDQNSSSRLKAWEQWMPDPIDAMSLSNADGNSFSSKSNIISMLVNIYGSKDMFVNEYKTLLADRLLSNYSYNMEKEIRNLELLKLKFGDSNLFACEAMLKDLSESKRINTNIIEQLKQKSIEHIESFRVDSSTLKCVILSEQFWPKLKEEKIEMPFEFKQIQERYMSSYEAFKGNRTLIWKNNLGLVTLDIEINNKITEFTVNPIQAAIIVKFQEKDTWSLLDLSQSLKMCSFALRKKLAYWKAQGLIKEVDSAMNDASIESENNNNDQEAEKNSAATEIYTLVKDGAKLNRSRAYLDEEEDENEKTAQSNEILKEQDLNLYWNYTQGMLRGCGCLPLERIHTWLKLYANPDLTIEQVKFLLETKTKEQLLKYNAGLYRLNR